MLVKLICPIKCFHNVPIILIYCSQNFMNSTYVHTETCIYCTFLAYLNELDSNEKKLSVAAEDAMVGQVIIYNVS